MDFDWKRVAVIGMFLLTAVICATMEQWVLASTALGIAGGMSTPTIRTYSRKEDYDHNF